MKRVWLSILALMLIGTCLCLAVACGDKDGSGEGANLTVNYTIQYTDAAGTHSILVEAGMPYSIEELPTKEGYEFKGLFDAKTGGTQYVDETGASLSTFKDKENLVLFPQFTPKEYAFVLDYQGTPVTGIRQFRADYDAEIAELPTNLTKERAVFAGWYTEPDCGGTQVADAYGLIPMVSVVKKENFDLTQSPITLYAGFSPETYTVTFYDDNGDSEEIKVVYNTPIKEIVPEFRKNGMAPLSWSKSQNGGEIFTGKVTADLVLYVAEWAPVLEFDAAGGKEVSPLTAKAGATISLPTPTRKDYTFAGWYTTGGVAFSATSMPESSATLVAHWNAQLIFDTRGGTDVATISEAKGTAITLPTTEKADYLFAGWYTEAGEKYESASMPEDSIKLQAKYYKVEHQRYVLIPESRSDDNRTDIPSMYSSDYYNTLDLSELYNAGIKNIRMTASYRSLATDASASSPIKTIMKWYSTNSPSDAYLIWTYSETHTDTNYSSNTQVSDTIRLTSPKLYVCRYSNKASGYLYVYRKWTDFWVDVEYPDMTKLY